MNSGLHYTKFVGLKVYVGRIINLGLGLGFLGAVGCSDELGLCMLGLSCKF